MKRQRFALAILLAALVSTAADAADKCKNPTAPKPVHRVAPEYTQEARVNHWEGKVVLEAIITEKGEITGWKVIQPAPYGLNETAIDALRRWRFEPGRCGGKAVRILFNVTLNFELDD